MLGFNKLKNIGGPGSGRGTICTKLKEKLQYKHLSTGELLKSEVMSGSYRGDWLYNMMSNGDTVPNEVVNDMLADVMILLVEGSDVIINKYK